MNAVSLVVAPSAISQEIDIYRVVKAVGRYTNGKASAVIFKNGSCTFPPLGGGAVANSISLLNGLPAGLSFNVREMDDTNFIVSFGEHVFSVVFRDDLQQIRDDVAREIDQSASTEVVMGRRGAAPEHFLIGIIARTRLLLDIGEPVVAASIGTISA